MARIDGLIILDLNGKPLITSHFPAHPASYPSVHIDAFNHALRRARTAPIGSDEAVLEPVVWVNAMSGSGGVGAALCHVQKEGLSFLVPVAEEVNPLFAFSFLHAFLDTLKEYLGEVTESTIKDNFDIVYMLIEEMLDEGHPMTMETSMLKEIVLPPTLMRKLLSAAGVSGLQTPTTSPLSAPIPWRRQGVRHNKNEIYFDITEKIDAIVDTRGNVLASQVFGLINCNSRLTGNPDLILSFTNANVLQNCAFHPCIRYNKWTKSKVLSFIPPDGRFKLLDYETAPGPKQLPLALKASVTTTDSGGRFSLTLSSRHPRVVEDIIISINLGSGSTSVNATASGDRKPLGHPVGAGPGGAGRQDIPDGHVGGGTWEFDPHSQVLKWSLASLVTNERPPTLTGTFTSSDAKSTPAPAFSMSFSIDNFAFSGLRVDQLKVLGDVGYKPFKGVRTAARAGNVEVRW